MKHGRADDLEVPRWALGIVLLWTAAWLLYLGLARGTSLATEPYATWWWGASKPVFWLAPTWWWMKRRGRPLAWLGLGHTQGLGLGLLAVAAFCVVAVSIDTLVPGRMPERPTAGLADVPSVILVSLIGPLLEELLFRGYALGALLETRASYVRANAEASVYFVLLHVPGWLFQERPPAECLALAAQIFLLGVLFGAVRARGRTLWSSVVFHVINNAWRGGWLLLASDALAGQ